MGLGRKLLSNSWPREAIFQSSHLQCVRVEVRVMVRVKGAEWDQVI